MNVGLRGLHQLSRGRGRLVQPRVHRLQRQGLSGGSDVIVRLGFLQTQAEGHHEVRPDADTGCSGQRDRLELGAAARDPW